jgi:hypothetical protein
MPGFFPPISLLNISVYRLQPRLFIDSNFETPAVGSIIFVGTVELVFFDTPRDKGNVSYCTGCRNKQVLFW